jgi:RNA recognition motif-containing protein
MATPEDAEQAISKLNGTSVDGRTIQVERAKSPGSAAAASAVAAVAAARPRW